MPRASHAVLALCAGLLSLAVVPAGIQAQLGDTSSGLPGVVRVGAPTPRRTALNVAASAGYAATEPQSSADGWHHRAQGALAGAFVLRDWFGAYLRLDGRFDVHPADAMGADTSAVGDLRLGARVGHPLSDAVSLGGELSLWTPGADAPSIDFGASTVDIRALLGLQPSPALFIGVLGGFRVDQSANSFDPGQTLRPGDMLSLGLSDFNAVLVGVGGSYRLGNTELLAEFSADLLVGAGAPSLGDSPMRVSAGVRQHLGEAFQLQAWLEAGLSGRTPQGAGLPLVPVEPRIGAQLGLQYAFVIDSGEARPAEPAPAPEPEPEPEPAPAPVPVVVPVAPPVDPGPAALRGRVLDDNGGVLAGARVSYLREDDARETTSTADGSYSLTDLEAGPASVTVTLAGYREVTEQIALERGQTLELDLTTGVDNPLGQIRGNVRSFSGEPVRATVSVYPTKLKVTTDDAGHFEVDVDPGSYTVRLRAYGYRSQNRDVEVQQNGVTVLNVELHKK